MSAKLFDTHTHYVDKRYRGGADALIQRILADNVAGFIAVGYDVSSSRASVALAERYDGVFAAVGVHPHDAKPSLDADYIAQLERLAVQSKVKAIGECGLDYHYDGYDRSTQMNVFEAQLRLAVKLNLPVIVHSRDATADTMSILREYVPQLKGAVMHCYAGSVETARELVAMGMLISFTGALTFNNARVAKEVAKVIALEHIMLETDCPYMAPQAFRGKTCDSSMAWCTAEKLAEIKGISVSEVVTACNNNAKKFFNIDF